MVEQEYMTTLQHMVAEHVLVRKGPNTSIVSPSNTEESWLFDFRSVLLEHEFLSLAAKVFWQQCGHLYPFSVGGLESASLPLIAAIVLSGAERGTPVSGFYIRKSRKPQGLQKIIEGQIGVHPVVLVDDLINSGGSFIKQINILEQEGHTVAGLFAFVRFRSQDSYTFLAERNIKLFAPLSLSDFSLLVSSPTPPPQHNAFVVDWVIGAPNPQFFHRVQKSAPVLGYGLVYFGSDNGTLWAVDQVTGKEVWHFKILGRGSQGKTIFSTPALLEGKLYFGAYDGNMYALDAKTGTLLWTYMDADWIGSSPCVAPELGLVYVGLEYGLWKKRGGIVALDAQTGKKKWEYIQMPELTHSSPAYTARHQAILIGSNDGVCYCFDAKTGVLRWQYKTGGDIKASIAFDEKLGYAVFGSFDGNIYVLRIEDGSVAYTHKTHAGIYSTPLVQDHHTYVASLDKSVYCIDLEKCALVWECKTNGRVFSSPMLAEGMLYVGSNDGRMYEIDPATGRNTAFFQTPERITNKIAYNPDIKTFFLPTYANQIYSLKKKVN